MAFQHYFPNCNKEKVGSAHPPLPAERRHRLAATLLLRDQIPPLLPHRIATQSCHPSTLASARPLFKMRSTDRTPTDRTLHSGVVCPFAPHAKHGCFSRFPDAARPPPKRRPAGFKRL